MTIDTLLDSNVIVALVADVHQHHEQTIPLFSPTPSERYVVSAHSVAEAFNTLTRRNPPMQFQWSPATAWTAVENVASVVRLIGLTPAQTLDAVRTYASLGGVGAPVYDYLVGQAAVLNDISTIITWNAPHFRSLFPRLRIETPTEFLVRKRG